MSDNVKLYHSLKNMPWSKVLQAMKKVKKIAHQGFYLTVEEQPTAKAEIVEVVQQGYSKHSARVGYPNRKTWTRGSVLRSDVIYYTCKLFGPVDLKSVPAGSPKKRRK